ncbi:Splicing factor 3A subunit 3, putative, expressed [Zostera marina]|uniref:Splicing factor 3A subunit 3, putative, expressed n=1 Tax=Zostera marina TaxID=29655 RepID=A0A0K9NSM5_ZOSMR|nr:Splicing factor 3A subunit 3, putative, expressed [Zostera marina]
MSSTLLEVTRAAHEEVERMERLVVQDLQREPVSGRERLFQNHRVRNMIETVVTTTEKLVNIYEDVDGARKEEISVLGGQVASGTNLFSTFYDKLKEIRDYHRRHPTAYVLDASEEYEEMLKEEPRIEFSGEEAFGRYLDMHELYNMYINSKFGKQIEYSSFLETFSQFQKIASNLKLTRQYSDYLNYLLEYLISFFQRTEPLQDVGRMFSKVETEFEELWTDGKMSGWECKAMNNENIPSQESLIDLDYYNTVEELMEVGPEKLKEALAALGLKVGGTVKQRADRLFLTKDKPLEQLDRKYFAKGSGVFQNKGSASNSKDKGSMRFIALMECKIQKLCELLKEIIIQTKENIEKKQALTYEEMEAEREDEDVQAESESDDEDQQIYNPLKLPMGWDGKPIPYWLYKLHGLGQEFKCEICGNHSYWGRRAFERHFKEWRHQHGMRCLNIPNNKNFNEITSIEESKKLWERIQARQGVNKWRPDLEEEYEDREGNIFNKKTYTDLVRQGLI